MQYYQGVGDVYYAQQVMQRGLMKSGVAGMAAGVAGLLLARHLKLTGVGAFVMVVGSGLVAAVLVNRMVANDAAAAEMLEPGATL